MNQQLWAVEFTKAYALNWKDGAYSKFLNSASKDELLRSQEPFYYAVEAFPLMLLKLASEIKTSEQRLLIIQNLWEEHGNGNLTDFHTETFQEHLKVLGSQSENYPVNHHIQNWIESVLTSAYSVVELSSYLAGIENFYAVISQDIALTLNRLGLDGLQSHYSKHAELDWQHGAELLDIGSYLGDPICQKTYAKAHHDFNDLFNSMVIINDSVFETISKNPVSFYYSREDTGITEQVLQKVESPKPDVFVICSGGEQVITYMNQPRPSNVFTVDANMNQINVLHSKLESIKNRVPYIKSPGKFEQLFDLLGIYLNDTTNAQSFDFTVQMNHSLSMVFTRKNLTTVFGDDAVKYSEKGDFADHFNNAIVQSYICDHVNFKNILFGTDIIDPLSCHPINPQSTLKTEVANLADYAFTTTFDIIDLSNIGDWMNYETYQLIINKAHKALNPNGLLVVRSLLGDHVLSLLLKDFSETTEVVDKTFFYTKTIIALKGN